MDLLELGADVEWPNSEASTEVRESLAGEHGLGRLASLAEWAVGVRPAGSTFSKVHAIVVGAQPGELVLDTAAAVGAEVHGASADGGLEAGVALADAAIERGIDLLVVAVPEMRADAAIAVSVLTNTEPAKVLARGAAATDPDAWMTLAIEVRDGRRRCKEFHANIDAMLAELASPRLAVTSGLVLRAATRRTPVLLDGPVAAAAALIAYEAQPRAVRWWAMADVGPDPIHELVATRLGQRPILGTQTGLGDGLAGMLALPVLRAATAVGLGSPGG